MTVLITGGTGLVGTRLLPRLIAAGVDCRVLVRGADAKVSAGATLVQGDILDPDSLKAAVEGVDAVVHLAAVLRTPDPALITRVNVEGTRNLIAAARAHAPGARVVMASTGLVYGNDLTWPAREDDPTTATRPYPASKIEAEAALRASGLNWSVLRFAFVYGDGDGHLQSAPGLLANWKTHPAQGLSLVHQRDIATAVQLALSGAFDGHTVNVADEAPTTIQEIAALVGADYIPSNEPLANPWAGRMDATLARGLGFHVSVPTVYQAARDGIL
ncbi:NAD-dependent epimerase/dehydratase family protein [Streptomyces sp. NPDC001255]|uniref:NAD-dependent epimerase/dehydratase family protein n=1 Tax=Streptomyces sp. NPDC001255 TaxID=3364550 RepID=UPI0036C4C040